MATEQTTPSKQFTVQEVSQHTEYGNLWVIINEHVYDLSKFADLHPAGRNVLKEYAGQDVTLLFNQFHSQSVLSKYHSKLCIGTVSDLKPMPVPPIKKVVPTAFGECVPFGDPMNVQGFASPYYNDSHREFRKAYRQFLETEIAPNLDKWDLEKKIPISVLKKFASTGVLGLCVGQPWPEKYLPKVLCGVKVDKPDYFHEIIMLEEAVKYSSIGLIWNLGTCSIGLPPILHHGSDYLKEKYIGPVLRGEEFIALAITEPWAGSDVAGLKTTATLSECGKFYILNGMKKFITTGAFATVFSVAARTSGEHGSYFGVSLLAVDKNMPGVKTRAMNMTGVWGSGTAFIIFENVKVPVENLIGDEGVGFMYIMQNFNHERFQIIVECVAASRLCIEECMKYAHQRETFGKKLIEQPVIRNKIANMIKEVESLQSYLELIAYNFQRTTKKHEKIMAAAIALAKSQGTIICERIVSEATQIFGGNAYQRGSVAGKIERYYREAKSITLGGGSPEVMMDMAVRQSNKLMPKPKI